MITQSNSTLQARYSQVLTGSYWALVVLVLIYLSVAQVAAAWRFTVDDAYITLRYAKHWAMGYGIVWNIGAPPVEGYSNFSFLILARLAYALHLNPLWILKSAGVVGLLLATLGVYRLTRFWTAVCFAIIPCVWLLTYRGEILWSVSGLETTVYQACLVWSSICLLQAQGYRHYPNQREKHGFTQYGVAGVGFGLASMTRPEAPVLLLLSVGMLMWACRRDASRAAWLGLWVFLAAYLVCFIPFIGWRWHYYARLLPNSVYCKAFVDHWNTVLDISYLRLLLPFIVCALPAYRYSIRSAPHLGWLWAPSIMYCVLYFGADPVVGFENRLFLPVWALFLPLSVLGLQQAIQKKALVYAVSMGFSVMCLPSFSLSQYTHYTEGPRLGEQLRARLLVWLATYARPGDRVVVADAGMIPYYSNLHFIDSYCLNNRDMTRYARQSRYTDFCRQVLLDRPRLIITTALVKSTGRQYTPADQCLVTALAELPTYARRVRFVSESVDATYYQYTVYERMD